MNTLLLQFYDLADISDKATGVNFQPRKMISDCKLNLEPALGRCRSAYGGTMDCEQVEYGPGEHNKAPFVVPVCPQGFQRYGCCKCLRKCDYVESLEADSSADEDLANSRVWTQTNYCLKRSAIKSQVISTKDKMSVGINSNDYESVESRPGFFVFIKMCPRDFKRYGSAECMAVCPLGWPDMGRKCLKQGELIYYPFVWQPGDGKVVEKKDILKPDVVKKIQSKKMRG